MYHPYTVHQNTWYFSSIRYVEWISVSFWPRSFHVEEKISLILALNLSAADLPFYRINWSLNSKEENSSLVPLNFMFPSQFIPTCNDFSINHVYLRSYLSIPDVGTWINYLLKWAASIVSRTFVHLDRRRKRSPNNTGALYLVELILIIVRRLHE